MRSLIEKIDGWSKKTVNCQRNNLFERKNFMTIFKRKQAGRRGQIWIPQN